MLDNPAQDLVEEIATLGGEKALILRDASTGYFFAVVTEEGELRGSSGDNAGSAEDFLSELERRIADKGSLYIVQFRKNETFHYSYTLGNDAWILDPI